MKKKQSVDENANSLINILQLSRVESSECLDSNIPLKNINSLSESNDSFVMIKRRRKIKT